MFLNFHRKIVLKQKKINPVEVGNKKNTREVQWRSALVLVWCGVDFFGEANYSRDFSKLIPNSPMSSVRIPRPEIPRGMSGRGRGISGPHCTYVDY